MARRGLGKGLGVFFSEDAAEKQPVKQEQEKTPQKKNLPDTGNGKTERQIQILTPILRNFPRRC